MNDKQAGYPGPLRASGGLRRVAVWFAGPETVAPSAVWLAAVGLTNDRNYLPAEGDADAATTGSSSYGRVGCTPYPVLRLVRA